MQNCEVIVMKENNNIFKDLYDYINGPVGPSDPGNPQTLEDRFGTNDEIISEINNSIKNFTWYKFFTMIGSIALFFAGLFAIFLCAIFSL